MTNPLDMDLNLLIDTAIRSLSERTDPLITRVNAGGILTNEETKQVLHDLFKLATIMKASAEAIEIAKRDLEAQDAEIRVMKVLLGLSDSEEPVK